LVVVVDWADVWGRARPFFAIGWLLPALFAVCLVLMLGLLMLWRIVEQAVFTRP